MQYNTNSLFTRAFDVHLSCDSVITVDAKFLMKVPGKASVEEISKALKQIGLYFASGEICMVKGDGKPRCFYCGTKQDEDAVTCSQCGAPL